MISNVCNSVRYSSPSSQGNHATCYDHPTDRNKVLLATKCPVRRILAKGTVKSEYFPQNVRLVGELDDTPIYEMDRYIQKWKSRGKLNKLNTKMYNILTNQYSWKDIKNTNLPERLKRDIRLMYSAIRREGYHVQFDICYDNVMITRSGKIVLNDIFWVDKKDY